VRQPRQASFTRIGLLSGTWFGGLLALFVLDHAAAWGWGATLLWAVLAPAMIALGIGVYVEDRARAALMAARVRRAMRRGHLVLHYQPKVDVATGAVSAVEALARWQHPRKGTIPPDQFIPKLERSRFVHRFNAFVIEEAVRQAAAWLRDGLPLRVAINVSPACLGSALVETVRCILDYHHLPAHLLQLEITEHGAQDGAADFERSADSLNRFHELGMSIALDDFGTGQSSLARLVALPVDMIKIDRSFVIPMLADPLRAEVVRTAIALAHAAGLRVVAEGVETDEHMQLLDRLGTDFAQGYCISRPLPAGELVAWLDRRAGVAAQLEAARPDSLAVIEPRRRDLTRRTPVPAPAAARSLAVRS
jgi:EAL domain-containing protein (putative c-di-GMP-specific phosphodiesterase class I)